MAIRNETVGITVARGAPQLRNLWGFVWAPGGSLATTAQVLAEVEYVNGTVRRFIVRPGAKYVGAQMMGRVWLTSASTGDMLVEVADEPGDQLSDAPNAPTTPTRDTQVLATFTGPLTFGADAGANSQHLNITPPAWARRGNLWSATTGGTGAVATGEIRAYYARTAPDGAWSPILPTGIFKYQAVNNAYGIALPVIYPGANNGTGERWTFLEFNESGVKATSEGAAFPLAVQLPLPLAFSIQLLAAGAVPASPLPNGISLVIGADWST